VAAAAAGGGGGGSRSRHSRIETVRLNSSWATTAATATATRVDVT